MGTETRLHVREGDSVPWLSVIMPTHHGERWIATALASVADAGDRGIECILIDSSSTPGTIKVARRFAPGIPLRVYYRPDLLPWTAKTNFGVEVARAPHICMLHQDDCWLPGRAAEVRRWIAGRPSNSVFVNSSLLIDDRGGVLGTWGCPLPISRPVKARELLEHLLVQNLFAVPAIVFPRAHYLSVGGMDPTLWYAADWDLYLKLAAVCDFVYCPQALTAFRIHGGSMTVRGSGDLADFKAQLDTVLRRHLADFQSPMRSRVLRAARASVAVNVALAAAIHGNYRFLPSAIIQLIQLGPAGLRLYLRRSRLLDRLIPRVKAKLAGRFEPMRAPDAGESAGAAGLLPASFGG